MRLSIPLMMMTSLAGCDSFSAPAEVLACESFIKEGLQAPASYSRIEHRSHDEPITLNQLRERHYPPEGTEAQSTLFVLYGVADELSLRSVVVEYYAEDTFGVPTRSIEQCLFLLRDGELDESERLESYALAAAMDRDIRNLASAGIVDLSAEPDLLSEEPSTSTPCCLAR